MACTSHNNENNSTNTDNCEKIYMQSANPSSPSTQILSMSEISNTIYVFIDASNLWEAQKEKGQLFDYEKLRDVLLKKHTGTKIKIFYYTAFPANGTRPYSIDNRFKFFVMLEKRLGYTVRKKELKRIRIKADGNGREFKEKGNMDVEMTIDVMQHIAEYQTALFFSGDSDFLALVTKLRNNGKKVFIYSSKNNVSEELKHGGNGYFDVLVMREDIWRERLHARSE